MEWHLVASSVNVSPSLHPEIHNSFAYQMFHIKRLTFLILIKLPSVEFACKKIEVGFFHLRIEQNLTREKNIRPIHSMAHFDLSENAAIWKNKNSILQLDPLDPLCDFFLHFAFYCSKNMYRTLTQHAPPGKNNPLAFLVVLHAYS